MIILNLLEVRLLTIEVCLHLPNATVHSCIVAFFYCYVYIALSEAWAFME